MRAELNAELLRLSEKKSIPFSALSFIFLYFEVLSIVLSDVGYFFVAQFHSIDVPRWSVMRISSRSRN